MKEYTLDCSGIQNPRQLHRALAKILAFPPWYGSNLDALYDCLTGITADTQLTLINFDTLASFANGFRRVLQDAEDMNPHFHVRFHL